MKFLTSFKICSNAQTHKFVSNIPRRRIILASNIILRSVPIHMSYTSISFLFLGHSAWGRIYKKRFSRAWRLSVHISPHLPFAAQSLFSACFWISRYNLPNTFSISRFWNASIYLLHLWCTRCGLEVWIYTSFCRVAWPHEIQFYTGILKAGWPMRDECCTIYKVQLHLAKKQCIGTCQVIASGIDWLTVSSSRAHQCNSIYKMLQWSSSLIILAITCLYYNNLQQTKRKKFIWWSGASTANQRSSGNVCQHLFSDRSVPSISGYRIEIPQFWQWLPQNWKRSGSLLELLWADHVVRTRCLIDAIVGSSGI